jgi:opacity protein-like surface antigen
VGYSFHNTNLEAGGADADLGIGGFNFGVGVKWTPQWPGKKFPRWALFGAFTYFPSIDLSGDLEDAGADGDDGFQVSAGVEHNFTDRFFANLIYTFSRLGLDVGGTDADFEDHRAGVNVGVRL